MRLILSLAIVSAFLASGAEAQNKPNEFQISTNLSRGQHRLIGNFGRSWTAGSAQQVAISQCQVAGKQLVKFEVGETSNRHGTDFVGYCQ